MSAIQIATEMRSHLREHRRRTRFAGQAEYLEAKDDHCRRLERLIDDLMRAIGTPSVLSLSPGERVFGRRVVKVVHRDTPRALRRA